VASRRFFPATLLAAILAWGWAVDARGELRPEVGERRNNARSAEKVDTTVGLEGVYLLRYAGALEARPAAERAPLVLRVAEVGRDPGGANRYELRYVAAVPGTYDLREYLVRVDGRPLEDAPPARVSVGELLPAEHPGDLERVPTPAVRHPWRYRLLVVVGAVVWLIPLAWRIARGLARRKPVEAPAPPPPRTLADQLRPLVERALAGELDPHGQAHLEQLLVAYWRQKLGLAGSPEEILLKLREHGEAGALVQALERWLYHRPAPGAVDLAALLAPYRSAEVLSVESAPQAAEAAR
jgi:hypothetical protein